MARLFDDANSQTLEAVLPAPIDRPLTMACWFKPDAATDGTIISNTRHDISSAYWGFNIHYRASDSGKLWAQEQTSSYIVTKTTTGVSAGNWAHAAAVYATPSSRSVYLNGGSKGTDATTNAGSISHDRINISGHYYNQTLGTFFSGSIAEAAFWAAALTDEEIAFLALGYSPLLVRPAALISYWPLIGRVSPEPDLMGAYPLTLSASLPVVADHPRILYAARSPLLKSSYGAAPPAAVGRSFAVIVG